jgi:serine/threonine-protein kinase PpkA
MAANPGYDALNVVENAARKDVALSVLHILTPQAAEAGNIAPAREVYARIAATGDAATPKYFPLDATDPESFRAAMGAFTGELVEAVSTAARGRRVEPAGQVAGLGDALVNEVFRAQLEYLGAAQGQAAPRFARAWAADTDLVDQTTRALSVKVFLTRQQLSALMEGAEAILSAYERQETGGGDFFDQIRAFSAQASVEGAGSRPVERAADLFPSFLAALPYRSDFLELDADSWSMGGPSLQRELTATLESKLAAYRDIAASREGWIDLGSGVRAEDVYPVSLDLLP